MDDTAPGTMPKTVPWQTSAAEHTQIVGEDVADCGCQGDMYCSAEGPCRCCLTARAEAAETEVARLEDALVEQAVTHCAEVNRLIEEKHRLIARCETADAQVTRVNETLDRVEFMQRTIVGDERLRARIAVDRVREVLAGQNTHG